VHALTVGSMGGLTIGMMTRTARGHTGRPLEASRIEVAAYVLLLAAAATRVLAPFLAGLYVSALTLAGALWCAAFTGYLIKFAPWLATTRADGRDG